MNDRISIIIADDDAVTRASLRLLLKEHGYRVSGEAADGEAALQLCSTGSPHIVFLDIDMPKVNGLEALDRIRQRHPDVKIIMVSGLATADNVRRALDAGVGGFVVKPFNAAKVTQAIERCLRGDGV